MERQDLSGSWNAKDARAERSLNQDTSVFKLLFERCTGQGDTSVDIDVLVEFIQKIQLGEQHKEEEETLDSHSSVRHNQLACCI